MPVFSFKFPFNVTILQNIKPLRYRSFGHSWKGQPNSLFFLKHPWRFRPDPSSRAATSVSQNLPGSNEGNQDAVSSYLHTAL